MAILSTERVSFEQALKNLLDQYGLEATKSGTILDTRMTLINYTKVKLDEVIPEGEGVQFSVEGDVNVSDPLNIMINSLLDEAAKRTLMNCPVEYLDPVKSNISAGTPDASDNKIGYIPLPANFLRFISLKMAEWKRAVTDALNINDPRYKVQRNKYTRGGIVKPVVVQSHRDVTGVMKRVLEYYSVNSSHNIEYLYYIQETVAEEVQVNLRDALTWVAAGMVLQVTERVDLAKVAFEQEKLCYQNLA